MKTTLKYLSLSLLFVCLHAAAQVAPGYPSLIPQDCGQYDCVNLQSLNVSLNVPVMSKSGAFPFSAALVGGDSYFSYNGTNLQPGILAQPITPMVDGILSPFGYTQVLYGKFTDLLTCPASGSGVATEYEDLYLQMADGTIHPLPTTDVVYGPASGSSTCNSTLTDQVIDGTGWTVTIAGSTYNESTQAGVTVVSSGGITDDIQTATITDSQSTANKIYYSSSEFFDTMGMEALVVNANGAGQLEWPDTLGNFPTETQTLTTASLKTSFGCSGKTDYPATSYPPGLTTEIAFPDSTDILLGWEPNEVTSTDYTGRLAKITLRGGGTITFNYNPSGAGAPYGFNCTYLVPNSLTRTTSDGKVTYTLSGLSASGSTTTKLDIGQSKTIYTFSSVGNVTALTQVQTFPNTGTIASPTYASTATNVTTYCYNSGASPTVSSCPTATVNEPITQLAVFSSPNGLSPSESYETFDKYGNVLTASQYDFGGSTAITVTTNTMAVNGSGSCSGISANVNNKPCSSTTTISGNTVGDSKYTYSSAGNLLTALYSPNGGSSFVGCTTSNSYNGNGTPSTLYDANCNATTFTYTCNSTYYSPVVPTYCPFATERTKGGLSTYAYWNSYGGVKTADKDASGNTTTYCYNNTTTTLCSGGSAADPWSRVMAIIDPLSNEVFKTYSATSVTSDFSFNGGNSVNNSLTSLDGYGRVTNTQKQQGPSASDWDTVSTYRGFSTVIPTVQTTNPCSQTSGTQCGTTYGPTAGGTVTSAGLVKTTVTQTGSNAVTTTTADENDVTTVLSPAPPGENTKGTEKEFDGLGRLKSSCAISSTVTGHVSCGQNTGGNSGILTTVTYSSATGSYTTKSCRGPSNQQCHTTVTDGMGRVTSKTTPEGGTWNYYYDTAASACTGSAASAGNLVCTVDPNGNVLNYFYDSNNRLKDVSANGSSCRWFYYDNSTGYLGALPTGISLSNQYGRMVEAATDSCQSTKSASTLLTDLWWNYDADGRVLTEWEQTPNSTQYYKSTASYTGPALTTMGLSSPVSDTFTYALDGEGRWNGLKINSTSYVTIPSGGYNAAGFPLTIDMGPSTDNDTYTQDPNTLLMTGWDFTVNSTSQTGTLTWNPNNTLKELVVNDGFNANQSLTYSYNANLVSGTGYDDLARLVGWSATCSTCGTFSQAFSFDQYNNITKSGTGFTAWNPTYSATTNHYACTGCTNDSNGNVTNDGTNAYTWNAFSKLASVNLNGAGCSTSGECIIYDALGRAVEFDDGSTKTEIWFTPLGKTAYMNGTSFGHSYIPAPGGGSLYWTGSTPYYMHKDWMGNSRVQSDLTNPGTVYTDRAYAPYGEVFNIFGGTSQVDDMFSGLTQDIFAGMYDTPNREMTAIQGRFMSPDPAGASWNAYSWPTNPNGASDPTGLNLWLQRSSFGSSINQFVAGILLSGWTGAQEPVDATVPADEQGAENYCLNDVCAPTMEGVALIEFEADMAIADQHCGNGACGQGTPVSPVNPDAADQAQGMQFAGNVVLTLVFVYGGDAILDLDLADDGFIVSMNEDAARRAVILGKTNWASPHSVMNGTWAQQYDDDYLFWSDFDQETLTPQEVAGDNSVDQSELILSDTQNEITQGTVSSAGMGWDFYPNANRFGGTVPGGMVINEVGPGVNVELPVVPLPPVKK